MLSRPKPGESEEDLLRFQNQFLETKSSPAVKLVKKADKRRGDVDRDNDDRRPLQFSKDVVMLDGMFLSNYFMQITDNFKNGYSQKCVTMFVRIVIFLWHFVWS